MNTLRSMLVAAAGVLAAFPPSFLHGSQVNPSINAESSWGRPEAFASPPSIHMFTNVNWGSGPGHDIWVFKADGTGTKKSVKDGSIPFTWTQSPDGEVVVTWKEKDGSTETRYFKFVSKTKGFQGNGPGNYHRDLKPCDGVAR